MAKKFDPKDLLERCGWQKGKGLGTAEHGIKEPIKVKLKMDTAGVGHDAGEEFTYHWWDHAFNSAAKNIDVDSSQKSQIRRCENGTISTKKTNQLLRNKAMLYGSFIKAATYENGVEEKEISDSNDSSDSESGSSEFKVLSDEQLFAACGGRTAHKGARHGLALSGKLARIAQQELNSARNSDSEARAAPSVETSETNEDLHTSSKKRKKQKKKKNKKSKELDSEEITKDSSKTKKLRKSDESKEVTSPLHFDAEKRVAISESATTTEHSTNLCKKKRKKDHKERAILEEEGELKENNNRESKPKKKKKKKSS